MAAEFCSSSSSNVSDSTSIDDMDEISVKAGGGRGNIGKREIICKPNQSACFLAPRKQNQLGGGVNGDSDSDDENSEDFLIPLSESTLLTPPTKKPAKKRVMSREQSFSQAKRPKPGGGGSLGKRSKCSPKGGGGFKKQSVCTKCGSKSRTTNKAGGAKKRSTKPSKPNKKPVKKQSKLVLIGGKKKVNKK